MIKNIFNIVRKAIPTYTVDYQTSTGRTVNNIGQYETTYTAPVQINANIQPVNQTLMQTLGLDFQKVYITAHLPLEPKTVHAGESGDILTFNGSSYKIIHIENWYETGGYTLVRAVQL